MRLNGKWGYINAWGEVVIDFQFDTAMEDMGYGYYSEHPGGEPFENGFAKVYSDGEWKIIDNKGNFVMIK